MDRVHLAITCIAPALVASSDIALVSIEEAVPKFDRMTWFPTGSPARPVWFSIQHCLVLTR
jgi:hypothetical protein